jgi:hypothetical protein
MTHKPDPSAPVQLDTSLSTKQLIDIRAEAIKIIEATNKAIAFGYFTGELTDRFGDIKKCQDEEFMNIHNSVDAILDSMGIPLVGDNVAVPVGCEIHQHIHPGVTGSETSAYYGDNGEFIPFVSIEDNPNL